MLKKLLFMQRREPIFGEKKLMGISFMRRGGSLEGQFTGISSRIFKGGNAKKGFCNTFTLYYILKVCFEKKIAHRIEKNIKIKNILELI